MCLAVPGKVKLIDGDDPLTRIAQVDFGGLKKSISMTLVPEAVVGDYVLVHAGIAIGCIDKQQAKHSLDSLDKLSALQRSPDTGDAI